MLGCKLPTKLQVDINEATSLNKKGGVMRIPKRAKRVAGKVMERGTISVDSESKAKLEALAMAGSLAGLLRYIANTLKRSDLVDLDKRRYGG